MVVICDPERYLLDHVDMDCPLLTDYITIQFRMDSNSGVCVASYFTLGTKAMAGKSRA